MIGQNNSPIETRKAPQFPVITFSGDKSLLQLEIDRCETELRKARDVDAPVVDQQKTDSTISRIAILQTVRDSSSETIDTKIIYNRLEGDTDRRPVDRKVFMEECLNVQAFLDFLTAKIDVAY